MGFAVIMLRDKQPHGLSGSQQPTPLSCLQTVGRLDPAVRWGWLQAGGWVQVCSRCLLWRVLLSWWRTGLPGGESNHAAHLKPPLDGAHVTSTHVLPATASCIAKVKDVCFSEAMARWGGRKNCGQIIPPMTPSFLNDDFMLKGCLPPCVEALTGNGVVAPVPSPAQPLSFSVGSAPYCSPGSLPHAHEGTQTPLSPEPQSFPFSPSTYDPPGSHPFSPRLPRAFKPGDSFSFHPGCLWMAPVRDETFLTTKAAASWLTLVVL